MKILDPKHLSNYSLERMQPALQELFLQAGRETATPVFFDRPSPSWGKEDGIGLWLSNPRLDTGPFWDRVKSLRQEKML